MLGSRGAQRLRSNSARPCIPFPLGFLSPESKFLDALDHVEALL